MSLCTADCGAFLAHFTPLLVRGQSPNDVVSDEAPTPICCTIQGQLVLGCWLPAGSLPPCQAVLGH